MMNECVMLVVCTVCLLRVALWRLRQNDLNHSVTFAWGEIALLPLVWVNAGGLPKKYCLGL